MCDLFCEFCLEPRRVPSNKYLFNFFNFFYYELIIFDSPSKNFYFYFQLKSIKFSSDWIQWICALLSWMLLLQMQWPIGILSTLHILLCGKKLRFLYISFCKDFFNKKKREKGKNNLRIIEICYYSLKEIYDLCRFIHYSIYPLTNAHVRNRAYFYSTFCYFWSARENSHSKIHFYYFFNCLINIWLNIV